MAHTRWTRRTDRILQAVGVSPEDIEAEKARKTALCDHKPRPKGVRFSPRLGDVLFKLGVSPEKTLEIQEYLDNLRRDFLGIEDKEAEEKLATFEADRKRAERDKNREAYNESQKLLMRERRAKEKQRSEAGKTAAKAKKAQKTACASD